MRSAKEIMESLEIAKGLCEGKTNESWNARKAGRVMAELIAHFKKKEIEEQVKTFSERMKGEMEKAGVKKWETDNIRLTYIEPTTKETFDSKRFKEENPESYKNYIKTTKVKSSIRITSL